MALIILVTSIMLYVMMDLSEKKDIRTIEARAQQ